MNYSCLSILTLEKPSCFTAIKQKFYSNVCLNMEDFALCDRDPPRCCGYVPEEIFVDASRYTSTFWIKDGADRYYADNQNTAARRGTEAVSEPSNRAQRHG